jgi:signal transduction histidine kinase
MPSVCHHDRDERAAMERDQTTTPEEKHFELVVQASELLGSSPDIREILERLIDQVIEVIKAKKGFILLRNSSGDWQFHTARSMDHETLVEDDYHISRSIIDQVAGEGRSIITTDAVHDERFEGTSSISLFGLKSIICVPLIIQGRVLGVIYADHEVETAVFGSRERTLLESIARQAAIAIENARLYEKMKVIYEESMERARRELRETQAQLFQSSKMAAMGQLAAGVAHEINNPLGAIELTASAMKRMTLEEKFLRRLDTIESAALQCKEIVRNLLLFSHPSAEISEKVDVTDLVMRSLALIEYQLSKDAINVEKSLQEGLSIEAGGTELAQVIMNILINARDALRAVEDEKVIHIKSSEKDDRILIEITDNGPGMEEEVAGRIFEPFFTTKNVGEGVGLGLSISFQIVRKYGGEIGVTSGPNKGTTFTLSFPGKRERG